MREFLNILFISALIMTAYVGLKVIRERQRNKKRVFSHFSFVQLDWDARSDAWQLHLELFRDEQLSVKALNDKREILSEQSYNLKPGDLTISLESKTFRHAKFVEVSSSNKTYLKVLA